MNIQSSTNVDLSDAMFNGWLENIDRRLKNLRTTPLFTTDVTDVNALYLDNLLPELRQYHNCHACRRFLERFGSLATISEAGLVIPALWAIQEAPDLYVQSVAAISQAIMKARITGVFLARDPMWGVRTTGKWMHLSAMPPASRIHTHVLMSPFQAMAEKDEDFKNVRRALSEFSIVNMKQAMHLLSTEALYRSEKIVGPLTWLLDLAEAVNEALDARVRENLIWRAIAAAPAGFCHPRASVMGSLLEDLQDGMAFDTAAKRFADKMRPDRYQRPVAPPKEGSIAKAEKIFEEMDLASALRRRFARPEEVAVLIWQPKPAELKIRKTTDGIFDHLRKPEPKVDDGRIAEIQNVTWVKFESKIMPTAKTLHIQIPDYGAFAALVTAVDPLSKPILQWDTPERRNQVSLYTYTHKSEAKQWGLVARAWSPLWGITTRPHQWFGDLEHQGKGILLLIPEAKDTRDAGSALFPETLRSELHAVRSVIEAHSRKASLEPVEGPVVSGLLLHPGSTKTEVLVRVTTDIGTAVYCIDRWD